MDGNIHNFPKCLKIIFQEKKMFHLIINVQMVPGSTIYFFNHFWLSLFFLSTSLHDKKKNKCIIECEVSITVKKDCSQFTAYNHRLFISPCVCTRQLEAAYLGGSGSASPVKLRGNVAGWAAVTEAWLGPRIHPQRGSLTGNPQPGLCWPLAGGLCSFHIHLFPGLLECPADFPWE